MRHFFFALSVLLLPVFAFASEPVKLIENHVQQYRIGRESKTMLAAMSSHITISKSCLKPKARLTKKLKLADFNCDASRALKVKLDQPLHFIGGQNPGAVACTHVQGKVVYALDGNNQITLCSFPDGSLVSSGTISYYVNRVRK